MELTAARRHWEECPREASWALPYSLSSSTTCLVKSREPYTLMIWSCGARRNTVQLWTIGCSGRLTSWKVGQNGGLSESIPGRPPIPSWAFLQRNRRPTCLSTARLEQSNRNTNHNDLCASLASLYRNHAVTLQWIPSYCNVPGNEAADSLAKEGTTKEQVDR